jgi:glutathione synthase
MQYSIGVIMDPLSTVNIVKDTTLAILEAAQERGYTIHFIATEHLFLEDNTVYAIAQILTLDLRQSKWYHLEPSQTISLSELDMVFMRTDPPFNMNYIYATYLLEKVHNAGTLVINNPSSIRNCNEKIFATEFPQCIPPQIISSQKELLCAFQKKHHTIILKPLDGMGGQGVFKINPDAMNIGVIIETLTQQFNVPIIAQRFIPEISQGDKRILMIDGEPIPMAYARIPSTSDHRGNLAAGGAGEPRALTERDLWICQQVSPKLKEKGLYFVGLDIIGDYLTEINVTSPTCLREISLHSNINIALQLLETLEAKLNQ